MYASSSKRERDRRYDAKRRIEQPWRALYRTREWRKLRAEQLRREPWCRMHAAKGEQVGASHVDHIEAHRGDPALFFDPANLQSL
jgi:5-methylcytosine-specific restriction endonuclease McrA